MAVGWAGDSAVSDQIDATVSDAVERARRQLPAGPSLLECEDCGAEILEARRKALPGVRLCVKCQAKIERLEKTTGSALYNRRGSKDNQLR